MARELVHFVGGKQVPGRSGWKRSGFGDLNQHGPHSVRFYTKTKTVAQRWPSGTKEGASFVIPTMA